LSVAAAVGHRERTGMKTGPVKIVSINVVLHRVAQSPGGLAAGRGDGGGVTLGIGMSS
jgi:hypothetical protein